MLQSNIALFPDQENEMNEYYKQCFNVKETSRTEPYFAWFIEIHEVVYEWVGYDPLPF